MKLIRFGEVGKENTGVVLGDDYYDTSAFGEDYNEAFLVMRIKRLQEFVATNQNSLPQISKSVRLGCPVGRPSKIVCIGLNYASHAKESGAAPPAEPVIFLKSTTAIVGPNDNIMLPQHSQKTDWEVELAVVIGAKANYVDEADAMNYVAGYCLHNDVSEREFQLERGGTWDKGKGCDTFAPIGPFMATKEEVSNPHDLRLWLSVNGVMMQDANTSDLIFTIPFLISYVSRFMTLLPGDIISTGTPSGVGLGMKTPLYLKDGDVVELGITGLGTSRQAVVAYSKAP